MDINPAFRTDNITITRGISMPTNSQSPRRIFASVLLVLLCASMPCAAAPPPVDQAAATTINADTADAILQELREIRRVLENIEKQGKPVAANRPAKPQTATVPVNKQRPVLGAADAPVTVVEFADYQCPFCLRFIRNTFPRLKKDYIDTGKVRWVALDMPMTFHKDARKAAQAAHCADEQGKFWEMRDVLFGNPQQLAVEYLPNYAAELSLDVEAFKACLDSDRHLAGIDQDMKDANQARLTGTPSFIIGKTGSDEISGKVIIGARPHSVFEQSIQEALD